MLSIYICEDDHRQRKVIEHIVKSYIAKENHKDIKLALSTDSPGTLLAELRKYPNQQALYILDVDLKHEMNGIILASEIRKLDIYGKIIFVTTYGELSHLTFQYKVEAMDYIIKDRPEEIKGRVEECVALAHKHFIDERASKKRGYQVKMGNQIRFIPFDDIIFFESSTHSSRKIVLHMENSWLEFYGSLNEVEKIGSEFFRCHQSYVINLKNIESLNKDKRIVEMRGGRTTFIAVRKVGALLKRMKSLNIVC